MEFRILSKLNLRGFIQTWKNRAELINTFAIDWKVNPLNIPVVCRVLDLDNRV